MAHSEHASRESFMRRCIALARQAAATGDTPVGSLIVRNDAILSEGIESVRAKRDVTAHAEIEALRAAFKELGSRDLGGCTLYTSVEPCVMCAYAIRLANIRTVVAGARTPVVASSITGYAVLIDSTLFEARRPPSIIRDVLAAECLAALAERGRPGPSSSP
jgi:tRNA(adenine34) deaminase